MDPSTSASTFWLKLQKTKMWVLKTTNGSNGRFLSIKFRLKMCGKCWLGDSTRSIWKNTIWVKSMVVKRNNSFSLSQAKKMLWAAFHMLKTQKSTIRVKSIPKSKSFYSEAVSDSFISFCFRCWSRKNGRQICVYITCWANWWALTNNWPRSRSRRKERTVRTWHIICYWNHS